ncbi:MAG: tetratricopeptide repeat protein [Pseudomonadota bacterium]
MQRLALMAFLVCFAAPAMADPQGTRYDGASTGTVQAAVNDTVVHDDVDPRTQYDLAMKYYTGHGMPFDHAKAAALFQAAAAGGVSDAQFRLGAYHLNSTSPQHDFAEAARLFQLAAEQDHARAQYMLAMMYERGDGVPQDLVRAHMWFDLAAASGFGAADQYRDDLSLRMTIDEIGEARRLYHQHMSN